METLKVIEKILKSAGINTYLCEQNSTLLAYNKGVRYYIRHDIWGNSSVYRVTTKKNGRIMGNRDYNEVLFLFEDILNGEAFIDFFLPAPPKSVYVEL